MNCQKCGDVIPKSEEHEFRGLTICEDCYMDALSPAKTCDPWAVYSAKSFSEHDGASSTLTPLQSAILDVLKDTGGLEPKGLCARLQLRPSDLDREIATLRHMEKVRAELREGRKVLRLW